MMKTGPDQIATVGFGEAGQAFASGWRESYAGRIASYDIKVLDDASRQPLMERGAAASVEIAKSIDAALKGMPAVFSLVTADQALAAARAAAPCLAKGAFWFDCNSCAPQTKIAAAEIIDGAGGVYVDAAVMAPVYPHRHRTPLLVSGSRAADAVAILQSLGMRMSIAGDRIGQASSVKMIRSVMIKGLEALTAEAMLTAHRAGVVPLVLQSLQASDPGFDWKARSAYNLERMMVHGTRRAAEMEEVAKTVAAFGVPSRLSEAIARWQAEMGGLDLDGGPDDLADRASRILAALSAQND